jgi:hypothetical protein
MLWSRLHGLPPGLRYLPVEDWPPRPAPLLTQPFAAGMIGWVVVFGAVVAELAGGAAVANQTSDGIAVPVLVFPVVVAFGFAGVQWWQVRSWGAEPASWWHLAGVAAAALTWLVWPMAPGALAGTRALPCPGSSQASCSVAPSAAEAEYLRSAAQALGTHELVWWSTGAVILIAALLARRSRIAAWAAIPAAFAGCELAIHFLN